MGAQALPGLVGLLVILLVFLPTPGLGSFPAQRPAPNRRQQGTPVQLSGALSVHLPLLWDLVPLSVVSLASSESELYVVNPRGPLGSVWIPPLWNETLLRQWAGACICLLSLGDHCAMLPVVQYLFHTFHLVFSSLGWKNKFDSSYSFMAESKSPLHLRFKLKSCNCSKIHIT